MSSKLVDNFLSYLPKDKHTKAKHNLFDKTKDKVPNG